MFQEISDAELLNLFYVMAQQLDQQFEFWLAATFSLVIASHYLRGQMSRKMFLLLETTYILFTLFILSRLANVFMRASAIVTQENERGINASSSLATYTSGALMLLIFVIGTTGAMYFLWTNYKEEHATIGHPQIIFCGCPLIRSNSFSAICGCPIFSILLFPFFR